MIASTLNRFASMNCFTALAILVFVLAPEMLRYLIGPLPLKICQLKNLLDMTCVCSVVIAADASMAAKYVYIFWRKNPASFNDDFWFCFAFLWISAASSLLVGSLHFISGFKTRQIDVCSGQEFQPNDDFMVSKGLAAVVIFSIVLQLTLRTKVALYKEVREFMLPLIFIYHVVQAIKKPTKIIYNN